MKKMLKLVTLFVALCLLAGCSAFATALPNVVSALAHASTDKATETPAPSEAPTASEAPAPVASEAPALVSNGDTVLPFEDIRPIFGIDCEPMKEYRGGCYTFCMGGKWGVMDADGTVIVPAHSLIPIVTNGSCFSVMSTEIGYAEWELLDNALAAAGYPQLVDATGIFTRYFFIEPGGGYVPQAGFNGTGDAGFSPTVPEDYSLNGPLLPCRLCNIIWIEDFGVSAPEACGGYVFCSAEGKALADGKEFESVGWFFDEPTAPVKQGGKWAYIGSDGKLLTDYVYDTYTFNSNDGSGTYAKTEGVSDASGGYAAVSRDGKWGILAADGTEIVPCTYAGAVNYRGNIWLKEADGWHSYALPGAPAITLAAAPTEETAVYHGAYGTQFEGTATNYQVDAQSGLILRAGPGTEYSKLITIPYGTSIACVPSQDEASEWVATSYDGVSGFVSSRYLRPIQ